MIAKTLIALVVFGLGSATAFAQEAKQFKPQASMLTRAEVLAELDVARQSGELEDASALYGSFDLDAITSNRTRADVKAAIGAATKHSRARNTHNYTGG